MGRSQKPVPIIRPKCKRLRRTVGKLSCRKDENRKANLKWEEVRLTTKERLGCFTDLNKDGKEFHTGRGRLFGDSKKGGKRSKP